MRGARPVHLRPGRLRVALAVALAGALAAPNAQSVREHTRPKPDRSTAVSESQATELTLTLTQAAVRPIQIWVRTAGVVDASGRTVRAVLPVADGALVKAGQRVRAFPPESRSSMYQARISHVERRPEGVVVTVSFAGPSREKVSRYVLEIVTENLEALSVPNEAIIESDGTRHVYVQQKEGSYRPREIQTGIQESSIRK